MANFTCRILQNIIYKNFIQRTAVSLIYSLKRFLNYKVIISLIADILRLLLIDWWLAYGCRADEYFNGFLVPFSVICLEDKKIYSLVVSRNNLKSRLTLFSYKTTLNIIIKNILENVFKNIHKYYSRQNANFGISKWKIKNM